MESDAHHGFSAMPMRPSEPTATRRVPLMAIAWNPMGLAIENERPKSSETDVPPGPTATQCKFGIRARDDSLQPSGAGDDRQAAR
jgi:hypothetical protein